jgi:hypothetical protein
MQSTFSKQVAYNQRVLEAESEIAGINCDIPHFLEDMTIDEPVYVCINSSEEMQRDEQAIAGQLWVQGNRQMTTSNAVPEEMANTCDSVLLCAAAEAVTWNHASQPDQPRKGQRIIIYPKDLIQLEEFLATSDPNVDPEDGHPLAYEVILRESQKFETTPLFLKEDSEAVINDPDLAAKVPGWLAVSRQVATGNRRRVLEDGADVANSSDEDDPKMKPDELTGMYTAEMDPKAGPKTLSQAEAARQRAAGRAWKDQVSLSKPKETPLALPAPEQERKPTPLTSPVNSDDEGMSEDQRRKVETAKRMSARAAASPRVPADQPKGAKAPPPTKGQESSGTKVPQPIETRTRRRAGAGGLRSGGGLGPTDTCVDLFNPSKT